MEMSSARIVFMGTPEFGCAILQELIDEGLNVVGVVCQPDKLVGRKQILTFPVVKQKALEHDIPVLQPIKIRNDYQGVLDLKPDLIVTCAYGQIIPKELLDYPALGCINVHASLLPALRGGAPIQHAIIDGYDKTGITIMEMSVRMDAGNIISQASCEITEEDTYGSLHDKLIPIACELLRNTMPSILKGDHASIEQNEAEVTFGYNISKEEEHLDLNKTYEEAYDQIRGLIPVPCCYVMVDGKKVKLWKVSKTDINCNKETGTIVNVEKDLGLVIDGKVIRILELQLEGKQKMSARDFRNGAGRNWEGKKAE
ncbi:MAG: methionyl-tRNA formyltransferase [Erysipelotrichaceae bacterium]|nr:methionyl-tRNA formyltransferase [Erysipelotrichaceae bacterium]